MSADVWLEIDTGGTHPVEIPDTSVNCTYNLSKMLHAAGFPGWRTITGAPASETGGMLRKVADTLRADPERFQAMNPPNGWGTYEHAVNAMDRMAELCAAHPRATWSAWL